MPGISRQASRRPPCRTTRRTRHGTLACTDYVGKWRPWPPASGSVSAVARAVLPTRYKCSMRTMAVAFVALALIGSASSATIPFSVFAAVHGRVVGWARSDPDWFVVYVDRKGGGWCGLEAASWRMALVGSSPLPEHVIADR